MKIAPRFLQILKHISSAELQHFIDQSKSVLNKVTETKWVSSHKGNRKKFMLDVPMQMDKQAKRTQAKLDKYFESLNQYNQTSGADFEYLLLDFPEFASDDTLTKLISIKSLTKDAQQGGKLYNMPEKLDANPLPTHEQFHSAVEIALELQLSSESQKASPKTQGWIEAKNQKLVEALLEKCNEYLNESGLQFKTESSNEPKILKLKPTSTNNISASGYFKDKKVKAFLYIREALVDNESGNKVSEFIDRFNKKEELLLQSDDILLVKFCKAIKDIFKNGLSNYIDSARAKARHFNRKPFEDLSTAASKQIRHDVDEVMQLTRGAICAA